MDIQDSNVIFEEEFLQSGTFKGIKCKVITGKLSYTPTYCKVCGIENQNFTIQKNGTQTSHIRLPFLGMYPAYLLLKKQR